MSQGTDIDLVLPTDIAAALFGANAPSAANPFATMADIAGAGTGTVTFVSVVTTNGFSGSVANPSTVPAITISTTVTGILKGDGTAVSAAVAGTDYTTPSSTETFTNKSGNISQWTNNVGYITAAVTSFSAGNLSPLFTTSVATASTTPALSFSLSNANANTWFGNNTGSAAAPAYNVAGNLTKVNDTNVTLALSGGTASLLNDVEITLGWTSTLSPTRGGTGISSYTIGDLLYANGISSLTKLAGVATGNVLISGGVATAPSWGKVGLTTHVSGTLPIANGGTNAATANDALNNLLPTQTSNSGKFLTTDGTNTSWALVTSGTVTSFSSGNLSPLFTTSVATATTTPALTFSLSNAGANTYFGNATGGAAAPSYTAAGSLTKTNDTNVTLTLGGSPTTSLLNSVSLTLGWTGTLADGRIASAATWNAKLNAANPAYTGTLSTGTLTYSATDVLASFQSSVNSYNQFIIQNSNSGAAASSDIIVNNNQSTDTTFYGDFGMNSSGFTGSGSFNLPNAVYLSATSADLVLGTTTSNVIRFVVNSGATDAMSISTAGVLTIGSLVMPTSATDTRIFFTDGTNTMSTNANFTYQKTTASATGGIIQVGGNTFATYGGIAATVGSTSFYLIGDRMASGYVSLHAATPTNSNGVLYSNSTTTYTSAATSLISRIGVNDKYTITATTHAWVSAAASSGASDVYSFTTPASTGQTAGSETMGFDLNMSATITHASNTLIALNRDGIVQSRTHAFASSGGIITDAYTWCIGTPSSANSGNPQAGTFATLTRPWALGVAGHAQITGRTYVGASGVAPTATIHFAAGTASASSQPVKFTAGTNLTSAEAGAVEWDGTNLFITQTSGPTRKTIAYMQGTGTNDDAAAGIIGEYVVSNIASGSAVSLTTATATNVTSISLTAGDWDVFGSVSFSTTGASSSDFKVGSNSTSATFGADNTWGNMPLIATGLSDVLSQNIPPRRYSLSATTTVYLIGQATFTLGTIVAYGIIRARRVR